MLTLGKPDKLLFWDNGYDDLRYLSHDVIVTGLKKRVLAATSVSELQL